MTPLEIPVFRLSSVNWNALLQNMSDVGEWKLSPVSGGLSLKSKHHRTFSDYTFWVGIPYSHPLGKTSFHHNSHALRPEDAANGEKPSWPEQFSPHHTGLLVPLVPLSQSSMLHKRVWEHGNEPISADEPSLLSQLLIPPSPTTTQWQEISKRHSASWARGSAF